MTVKSVDINRGNNVNHDYMSRLVAKHLKLDNKLDLFASTPPFEPKKILFSTAATEGIGYKKADWNSGMKTDFVDITRAFLQAHTIRAVYADLPREDSQLGMCGRLKQNAELRICPNPVNDCLGVLKRPTVPPRLLASRKRTQMRRVCCARMGQMLKSAYVR